MQKQNPLLTFWRERLRPWLLKARCALSEDYHRVDHWEFDESGEAAGHGICIYCGQEVSMSMLMGRNLGGRSSIEGFADAHSRSTCPQCGSSDYDLLVYEDGKSMPEYIEIQKHCKQCGHYWGKMGFSPSL